jgi:hypothetical protein
VHAGDVRCLGATGLPEHRQEDHPPSRRQSVGDPGLPKSHGLGRGRCCGEAFQVRVRLQWAG